MSPDYHGRYDESVVGWSRPTFPGREYYCPPHVPRSQRTLGEKFAEVTVAQARRVDARCECCGALLDPERKEVER